MYDDSLSMRSSYSHPVSSSFSHSSRTSTERARSYAAIDGARPLRQKYTVGHRRNRLSVRRGATRKMIVPGSLYSPVRSTITY